VCSRRERVFDSERAKIDASVATLPFPLEYGSSAKYLSEIYTLFRNRFYTEPSRRAIVCNTIRFYLMYKSLYDRNIYLQILCNYVKQSDFRYRLNIGVKISANNRNDPSQVTLSLPTTCISLGLNV
jgi:hypothetical protein